MQKSKIAFVVVAADLSLIWTYFKDKIELLRYTDKAIVKICKYKHEIINFLKDTAS